jgi:hypothetical protein
MYDNPYLELASSIIGTAAVLAAITPNTWDNKIVQVARNVLDLFAFNWGGGKNAAGK